ncbi:MAG: UvrD-helicase domain-containing protein [Propionibacteriaceae bacterium]
MSTTPTIGSHSGAEVIALADRLPTHRRLRGPDDLVQALGIRFSDQQLAAITAPLRPGVIIAGAGSGKTTVMAARVVWLVGTGAVAPEQVLGLTFTRKAAAELSQRVRAALDTAGVVPASGVDESGEQLIMTYDAFAARLVAEHGLRLGMETDPTMISGATRYRLASRVVNAAAGPFEQISRLRPGTVTDRVLRLDGDLQQHLVGTGTLGPHARGYVADLQSAPRNPRGNVYVEIAKAEIAAQERLELASLVAAYQQLKTRLGLVEFADQMAVAARLATELPEVSAGVRDAYRVVLLDEYQDTSAAQAIMLRGLFSGATEADGRGHPVTAVGDPFQAIYGWRGAAASNILQFATDFPGTDQQPATSFALTVNRRSGTTVLDVANVLAAPLRAVTGSVPGAEGELLVAPPGTPPASVRGATFHTWPEEVSWVADTVAALHEEVDHTGAVVVQDWADVAVLTRRNADIGPLYVELTGRDIPVEIVGLGGLLTLPEVMDVVSTLRLVDDVTANPDLIRLLGGPRWAIGPRDLALLGRRARELAQTRTGHGADQEPSVLRALEEAVADVDPTEVICLLDALDNPGPLPYSAAAQDRFARCAAELAGLRRHGDEPVLDLTRRVVATLGVDVELMATPEFATGQRRDQLGAFLDAVAGYVDVDGSAALSGLLSYFDAEVEQGSGLDQAVPSDRDAVKLLTVHRAKGLEWSAVVLPALIAGVFPSDRVSDNWVTNAAVLPADLRGDADSIPQLSDVSNGGLKAYKEALKRTQSLAEDRLGYVAVTRARRVLVGSGHTWRPEAVRPRSPSAYLKAILAEAERQGQVAARAPVPGDDNPLEVGIAPQAWPRPYEAEAFAARTGAAARVEAARKRYVATGDYDDPAALDDLLLDQAEQVAQWDDEVGRLLAEARADRSERTTVALPATLTATQLLRLAEEPATLAVDLARPMPRSPSQAARFGTRFHQWVERYVGGTQLVDPDDLPDRADADLAGEADLREVCDAFARGRFGARNPVATESPFTLLLGGQLVRGRIDAVYADASEGGRALVVDWKTSRHETADPLQLAIYRVAWAELTGVPLDRVEAAFYYVRTDRLVHPTELADRAELEELLSGVPEAEHEGSSA